VYNHVSLAFDGDLDTLVSYNGGNGVSNPGLNAEPLEFFNRKAGASLVVYRLGLTPEQKRTLIGNVARINREGSSYNLRGLLTGKSTRLPNIMFCSQFVYSALDEAGLAYFEREAAEVRPEDFIQRPGPLEFVGRIVFPLPRESGGAGIPADRDRGRAVTGRTAWAMKPPEGRRAAPARRPVVSNA
jgi:hypothetical protein